MADSDVPALFRLRSLFDDRPDLLDVVTLADAQSQQLATALRSSEDLFAEFLNAWVVGRTGSGKSSFGNALCGLAAMPSTGHMDCTHEIGVLRMLSNFVFIDTPGGGSKEEFENVTRIALALPPLPDDIPDKLVVRDYSPMLSPDGQYVEDVVDVAAWPERGRKLTPDVVVFFAAPHHQFTRADKDYLRAMYRGFGERVVVALNLFRRDGRDLFTPQNLADTRSAIAAVHAQEFPGSSAGPHLVEINTLTRAGLDELTAAICAVVPPQKIGRLENVLREELKPRARQERDRRFRHAVHSIAARLAQVQVDHRAWGQDLLALAAVAVAQFATETFTDPSVALDETDAAQLHASLHTRAGEVKENRTETLVTEEAVFGERDIFENVPEFRDVTRTLYEERTTSRTVHDPMPQGFIASAGVLLRAAYEHADAFLSGADDQAHDEARERMRKGLNPTVARDVIEVDMVPHTFHEKEVSGYRKEKAGTITEVVGTKQVGVGTRALQGGIEALELLMGSAGGVRAHLLADGAVSVEESIGAATEQVRTQLAPIVDELSGLLAEGSAAEERIVALLDRRCTR